MQQVYIFFGGGVSIQEDEVKVKSLYKAVKLLDYFTAAFPERGISELANLCGLPKSSVHNIISTFEACRFIEKCKNGKYRLGPKVLELSSCFYVANDLRQTARPFLEKICDLTSQTVYFAILGEGEILYLDAVYPRGLISARSILGIKAPLYCTGVGKAMLAFLTEDEINDISSRAMPAFTDNTITNKETLLSELNIIRNRGYAIDNMEHEFGIRCVATPIRSMNGTLVAAISVSGSAMLITDDKIPEYAKILIETAGSLNKLIR